MSQPTVHEARSRVYDDWAEALHNGGGDVDRAIDYLPEEHRQRVFFAFNAWQAFAEAIHADAVALAREVDRLRVEADAEHAKAVALADRLRAEREGRTRVAVDLRRRAEERSGDAVWSDRAALCEDVRAIALHFAADLVERGAPIPSKEG